MDNTRGINMKNQSVYVLLIALLSTAIAACDGDNRPPPPEPTAAPPPPPPEPTLAGGQLAQDFADATAATTNALNGVVPGSPSALPPGEVDDDDFAPAPPSIGADIPVTYFGPPPTTVNRNLVGPLQLLTAGTLDLEAMPQSTITLPLYEGRLASGGPQDGATLISVRNSCFRNFPTRWLQHSSVTASGRGITT
jgi:hypothetical protein